MVILPFIRKMKVNIKAKAVAIYDFLDALQILIIRNQFFAFHPAS